MVAASALQESEPAKAGLRFAASSVLAASTSFRNVWELWSAAATTDPAVRLASIELALWAPQIIRLSPKALARTRFRQRAPAGFPQEPAQRSNLRWRGLRDSPAYPAQGWFAARRCSPRPLRTDACVDTGSSLHSTGIAIDGDPRYQLRQVRSILVVDLDAGSAPERPEQPGCRHIVIARSQSPPRGSFKRSRRAKNGAIVGLSGVTDSWSRRQDLDHVRIS